MTVRHLRLHPGSYRDSIRLMQVSQAVQQVPGVTGALVAMATDVNLGLAAGMGFTVPDGASPNDMLVAVSTVDDRALAAALDRLAAELDATGTGGGTGGTGVAAPPRTVAAALRRGPADLVLVSTPGEYAFLDAMDALDHGANVLVFSDNVPVAQEIALKDKAAAAGLLALGPDCGTAVVGGLGLGFANVVRPGPVGLVAASGTGAQQVMALLDAAGVGVSHCLGVGGRDLSAAVAGRGTRAALDALDADPGTELIVVVGKPPAATVADAVRAHADRLATPVRLALLGPGQADLAAAVRGVLAALGVPAPVRWPQWTVAPAVPAPRPGALRGLYAGGSLCDEAMVIASAALGPVASNIPLRPQWRLAGPGPGTAGHWMLDLGDDGYTRGRPHPMIDGGPRRDLLDALAGDEQCAVVLLDVVLGHGADPDPAATLAPAVAAARHRGAGRGLAVVVALVGTRGDPQDLAAQAGALRAAGADVFAANADAARHAVALATGEPR